MESPTLRNPSSVVNLNLSFKNVTNLQDIKQYKNLIELDLSGNNFPSPNEELAVLKNFNYLKKLNLTYTNLESIPSLPKNLETLILNNNTISQIGHNLLILSRLVTLDLSNNEIEDVSPLLKLINLKHLFLKNNKVRNFGMLSSLTKLQELDLDSNFVSELAELLQFAQHANIKVLCIRNTPLCNEETSRLGTQSILPNLPFYKDGAFCKSGKSLKSSFTYTNMLETSNPNRSVLINKSLINSKKNFSDSDLSDDFSFDQEPETVNASILGSVRSNILDTAFNNNATTENSMRVNRMHHQSLDASRIPSQFESKMSDFEKVSTRQNSQRVNEGAPEPNKRETHGFNFNRQYGRKAAMNMKLDLSAILKTSCGKTSEMTPINVPGSLSKDINDSSQKIVIPHFSSNNSANGTPQKLPMGQLLPVAEYEKDNLKISANQTINSFVNQLESADPVSSYRVTFQNDNLPIGEAYEALKKENLELEKIKEDLMQRLTKVVKENDDLKKDAVKHKGLHHELTENIEKLRYENEALWQENGDLKNQMEDRYQSLRAIYIKYIENKDVRPFTTEELSFDKLLENVEEKLKKTNLAIQAEMNKRILEKFDQLRDYYRHKQDRLLMNINDLESRLAFQAGDKISALQTAVNSYQINYQTLYKKYNKLKKSILERNKTETSNVNLSLNQSSNPNFSNISVETDVSLNQSTSKSRPFESNFKVSSNIKKENNRADDPINNLQSENRYLKNSLEGVSKKMENLVRENDELKTETNRNAYLLKMRIRELENENSNLLCILKQHKIKSPGSSFVLEKSADSIPKITSAKNARSYAINLDPDTSHTTKDEPSANISLVIESKKKDHPNSHSKTKTPTLKIKKKTIDIDSKHKEKSSSKKNVVLTAGDHEPSGAKAHLKHMFTELSAIVKGVAK